MSAGRCNCHLSPRARLRFRCSPTPASRRLACRGKRGCRSFCIYCQDHTTDRYLTTYSRHSMLPRKLSPLLPRACHVLRSNFCQLIMATLKFYKHLLIDYDRHLTTYTEQFFSCFLLLQPPGPCFYLPPYSWRLPASYPVQQAPDSVCVSMGPGLSRALLYDFYCRFIFTVSLQEIHHFTA